MSIERRQNVSNAVMMTRVEPRDSLDDFPTPPWATRALCEWLKEYFVCVGWETCREPAANRGHMVKPLREYFEDVEAADVHDYGAGYPVRDFLSFEPNPVVDWTITNPPFRLAEQFIVKAMNTSRVGVAIFIRSTFLEGTGRWERLFQDMPPNDILQFAERVVLHKGKLAPKGSTATAYCWLVWRKAGVAEHPRFHWIPPCRKALERSEDYE